MFGWGKKKTPAPAPRPPVIPKKEKTVEPVEQMDGGFFNLPVASTPKTTTENNIGNVEDSNKNNDNNSSSMFGGLAVHSSTNQDSNNNNNIVDTSTTILPDSIKLDSNSNNTNNNNTEEDLFMGLSMTPNTNSDAPTTQPNVGDDSNNALGNTSGTGSSGFSFLGGSTTTTTEENNNNTAIDNKTAPPPPETSGFGFMSTPQQQAPPLTNDMNNAINNNNSNNNGSSAISNFLTPSDDNQTKVEPTSSKTKSAIGSKRSGARSRGGPINIIKKKTVRKKRSARKRIGFDREKAMEELNQSETGASSTPQITTKSESNSIDNTVSTPTTTGDNNSGGGGGSSLLSGMKIHNRSSTKEMPPLSTTTGEVNAVANEMKIAAGTIAETVPTTTTLPTYRGSMYTEDNTTTTAANNNNNNDDEGKAPTIVEEEENNESKGETVPPTVEVPSFSPPDLSSVTAPKSTLPSVMMNQSKDNDEDNILPPPDKVLNDIVPPPSTTETNGSQQQQEEEAEMVDGDGSTLSSFVKRIQSKFAILETKQSDLENQKSMKKVTIENYRKELNDVTAKQHNAISKEDFEAAESYENGINECKQKLIEEERALENLLSEINEISLLKEKLMQDQVTEITSISSNLKEKETVQKGRIEAHDTVITSRKANDSKRLQVLEQKLELDEEHVLSDKKSLEEDRTNLDEKIKGETSTFSEEKTIWETQRNDVQSEIDILTEKLQKKQREMETIVSKINENELGIQNVMEIYLPRNQELEARKTKLEEKEESCNEQRLRIQEIKDSINNTVENSNVEKEELVKSLNEIQSNQKFVTIVSTTLKEVGTLRSSITEIVNESTQYKAKMMVDIDLANQSYSVAKAQEEELEAKVEEYRNKLSIIDERLPALTGEKKRAIQAKNFKAAGRVTGEIKKFTADREVMVSEMDVANNELNDSVSLSNDLQDKVKVKEQELSDKGKEYDLQRLDIEKNQRRLINKALRKFKRISKKFGVGEDKSNPSKDLLLINLSASQVEIGKLCLKYDLQDVMEEEEDDSEEEEEEEQEEQEQEAGQQEKDVGETIADEDESAAIKESNDNSTTNNNNDEDVNNNVEATNGFSFMQEGNDVDGVENPNNTAETITATTDNNNDDEGEKDKDANDMENTEATVEEVDAKEEEIDLEAIRMEKVKRIEELEGLVEEAVGDDDFEKAELYQNEIDELKAEMM